VTRRAEDYLARFAEAVVADALRSATPEHWLRRAEVFAAVGTDRCDEIAQACRNAATFWRSYGAELLADDPDVESIVRESMGAA